MNIGIYEDVIGDVDTYVNSIFDFGFEDVQLEQDLFKSVQIRGEDELFEYLSFAYPNHETVLNFARRSPKDQEEPNWIHTDEMMGDLTAILYLNNNCEKIR